MVIFHHFSFRPLLLVLFLSLVLCPPAQASSPKTYFPEFSAIRPNITFWERIYGEFSVNTAVIHDREDLTVIYEAVPLLDRSLPGADRLNRNHLRAVKQKYAHLLGELARGRPAQNAMERRIATLFAGPQSRERLQRAAANIRIQRGLKERFLEGVIRSGGYLEEMKRIFTSYGLPEDLAYLPHVESSFNIRAHSKFGASGIWQFTRATGKNFMTIDSIVDERRDPLTATHAAARYLKQNFANLGTWPLAITAYNYGHAGMLRAVRQEGTYENIFANYRQGHFKFASRNFYAEFLAARRVAKALERLPGLQKDRPLAHSSHAMPAYAAASELAAYLGLRPETLKRLNPALGAPVWQGEKYIPKGYLLRLPRDQAVLGRLRNAPPHLYSDRQKASRFYTVRRGDTAGHIARRFGVSLASLSETNDLGRNGLVYIGQTLRIPGGAAPARMSPSAGRRGAGETVAVLRGDKKNAPDRTLPARTDLAIDRVVGGNGAAYGEITVQPEESLALFAEWLQTDEAHLHTVNDLGGGRAIHPGQQLKIPLQRVSRDRFEKLRLNYHRKNEANFFNSYRITGFKEYRVALGDTLWDICQKKFDLPLWLLKKYNHDLQYNRLDSNQHLRIPIIEAL